MQRIELEVKPRDLGKKENLTLTQLRQQGWIPAVIYGHGPSESVAIEFRAFLKATRTKAGINALFNIKSEGKVALGVIKEIQRHILNHKPIHVDLQRINVKEKLEITIPVHVVGEAPGVKLAGGILELIQREIKVKCLPDDIPASIDVDVSQLQLGQGIKIEDITPPKGVEFLTAGDHIVINIVAPKIEEEKPAAVAGAEVPAAPEVIAKGKKEEEGAAPAAGGAAAAAAPEKGDKEKKK